MAVISIDLDAMAALVSALKQAREVAAESAVGLTKDLEGVWLSSMSVAPWREGGYALATLDQMIADCERRLAKAQEINHSRPGIPRVTTDPYGYQYVDRVVSFEEDDLATADADAAAAMLTQIMDGTIHVTDGLPPELVSMLLAGMDDPVFAHRLTDLVPPDVVADVLFLLQVERGNLVAESGDRSPVVASFDLGYGQALDILGAVYSVEARSLPPGSTAAQTYLTQWEQVFFSAPAHTLTPSLLALVIGRGQWPDEFLTGITDAITVTEGAMGAAYWGEPESVNPDPGWPVADPGRSYQDVRPTVVGDPMYGVWSAAVNNPEWMAAHYQDGTHVDVTIDRTGYDGTGLSATIPNIVQIDQRIADLFRSRGMDEASVNAFLMAASVSDTTKILSGATGTILDDAVSMGAALDREQRLYDELPWWTKYGHTVVETVSTIAGLAVMVIPGTGWAAGAALLSLGLSITDVTWYAADGDWTEALTTGACLLIPVVVGGAVRVIRIGATNLAILRAGGEVTIGGRTYRFLEGKLAVKVAHPQPFDPKVPGHLADVPTFNAKGVTGGHNLASFEQAFRDVGISPADVILSKTQIHPGVYQIEYRVPLLNPDKTPRIPVEWKIIPTPKTVYDPAVISDAWMYQYSQEAMEHATLAPGSTYLYQGFARNGWKFEGALENGVFTSVYPVP